jgi:hypothetical protein
MMPIISGGNDAFEKSFISVSILSEEHRRVAQVPNKAKAVAPGLAKPRPGNQVSTRKRFA